MAGFRISRLFRPFDRLAGDRSGVAALEFALILPLMLTIYIGGNEFGHAFTLKRKVTHVASTMADLVTQSKKITNADMSNIFDASEQILWPYPVVDARLRVSLIKIDSSNVATVVWSDARNDTPLAKNSVVTGLPSSVAVPNTFIVTAEVHYAHTPLIGYVLTGTFDLNDQFYLRPRLSDCISRGTTYTC